MLETQRQRSKHTPHYYRHWDGTTRERGLLRSTKHFEVNRIWETILRVYMTHDKWCNSSKSPTTVN